MSITPLDRLQAILLQSKIQKDNPPLYQVIKGLIGTVQSGNIAGGGTGFIGVGDGGTGSGPGVTYELGSFTPVLGGDAGESGQAYTFQTGHFVRLNDLISANIYTQFSNKGTINGNLVMKGLPFVSMGTFASAVNGYMSNLAGSPAHPIKHGIVCHIPPGQSYIKLFSYDDYVVQNPTEMSGADVNNATQCILAVTYTRA